ncbi:MAG: acyloxyacyl hydrolase [Bacteroidota bacterium]
MIKSFNLCTNFDLIGKYCFVLFSLVLPLFVVAQTDTILGPKCSILENFALQGTYQSGHVFATNKFLRGVNSESAKINAFQAFSFKMSRQTTGKYKWEQLYKYPQYGVGIYVVDFFHHKEIGVPIAVFGFFNAPFLRWNKLLFNYEIGFGATFNWKAFNPVTNHYNVAIGAGESFLVDAGLNLQYLITKRIELVSGFSLTHFSNGALKKPNFGINTLAPKLSIKYNFYNKPHLLKQNISEYTDKYEWLISAYGGLKNMIFDSLNVALLEKYEGVNFPVFGLSTVVNRQINYKSKIGIGITLSYNGAINAQASIEANELETARGKFSDKILLSIYPSYELVVNRMSITLQPAFYLYRKKLYNQSPVFHQRIGLKYHITNQIFAGITLVDYKFHVSDFIEWYVGYRIKWN